MEDERLAENDVSRLADRLDHGGEGGRVSCRSRGDLAARQAVRLSFPEDARGDVVRPLGQKRPAAAWLEIREEEDGKQALLS